MLFQPTHAASFQLLAYQLSTLALRQSEQRGQAALFYIYPWELDAYQPRVHVNPITRLRHYGRPAAAEKRLRHLLGEFRFTSVPAWLALGSVATATSATRGALLTPWPSRNSRRSPATACA